jgi:RNA polymerase sigma-70 factor, ECF subfamily
MLTREGSHDCAAINPSQLDLESWIEAARLGDREALGRAMVSFRDYLFLVANEAIKPAFQSKGGASDIVQETFFRAQRGFESFRGRSIEEWRGWLRNILVRQLANQHRRYRATAKRQVRREVQVGQGSGFDLAAVDETPSRDLERRELETDLMKALARLPDHDREVVIEHNREKLAFDEIGRRRGISAEAARKLWSRALGHLRKELGPDHDSR